MPRCRRTVEYIFFIEKKPLEKIVYESHFLSGDYEQLKKYAQPNCFFILTLHIQTHWVYTTMEKEDSLVGIKATKTSCCNSLTLSTREK